MPEASALLSSVQAWLAQYGLRLLGAIAIFFIGRIVIGWLTNMARRAMDSRNLDKTLSNFAANIIYFMLLAAVVIAALNLIGFETTSIVAIMGAAAFAVGFALQDSLANFAAGVMIVFFRPYKIGDLVEIAGAFGVVDRVDLFNTVLTSPDNKEIIVANGAALGSNIVNYSAKGHVRLDMVFGIGYEDDLLKAKEILLNILTAQDGVLKDPAPSVTVLELADSSVNFAVRPYVTIPDYWDVYFTTHEQVKLQLDAAGISIPYPQQDVHMHQVPG